MVYDPVDQCGSLQYGSGGVISLDISNYLEGTEVQVWATFVSADEKLATNFYLVSINVI